MKSLKFILKYITHCLTAVNTKGHGIHSPYVFQLVNSVFYNKNEYYVFDEIEKLRNDLLNDKRTVFINDFGTGADRHSKVSAIARKSVQRKKHAQLLFRLVCHAQSRHILELGTSLGVTTAYLASASKCKCVTLEGSPEIAKIAVENFRHLGLTNINLMEGDINKTLPTALKELDKVDFVFVDANHSSAAVLDYFDQCVGCLAQNAIMVFDDIYWSGDMEMAWNTIKSHPKVKSTIDIHQMGIVFFNADLSNKHYKICY